MIKNIISKTKSFLISRPLIRFYRITGFGIFSVLLVGLLELVPQLDLSPTANGYLILILTSTLTAVDKYLRDLKINS